ncbi:DMT family transporter [Flavobacterium sp. '19STA2R22 D10 B1']|uniref:DMT family transporter n=1 Tax=Flavobacterium aerium TaxID=3037261 RepID=UPI00278C1734|nr:DMT family transporter [Flavobacterium sp. '19STA2R22 D10 B1']
METKQSKWFYLLLLALIWGSSFILIKRGLVGLTAVQLGSLRIIFAALFLSIVGFKSLKEVQKRHWKYIALTAFVGTFTPVYLFSYAQTEIDSSISAILNSLTPLNTLILGFVFFGVSFQRRQLLGVIIGFLGCIMLILHGAMNHPEQNYFYVLFVVIAAICYALNINLIKKYLSDLKPFSIVTGNFMVLGIPALVILFFTGFNVELALQPQVYHSMFFIVILGILGTGIANIIFFKLIQMSSPIFASSVTYLIPVVALSWGIFDNESLTLIQYLGAAIILIGVYLSSRK